MRSKCTRSCLKRIFRHSCGYSHETFIRLQNLLICPPTIPPRTTHRAALTSPPPCHHSIISNIIIISASYSGSSTPDPDCRLLTGGGQRGRRRRRAPLDPRADRDQAVLHLVLGEEAAPGAEEEGGLLQRGVLHRRAGLDSQECE